MPTPPKATPKGAAKTARDDVIDVDADTASGKQKPAKQAQSELRVVGGTLALGASGEPSALKAHLTEPSWITAIGHLFSKPYFTGIDKQIASDTKAGKKVLPPLPMVFTAFNECPFDKTRVVLIGQDPYPTPGHAHGLCFSVLPGVGVPKSLVNMYTELEADVPGFTRPRHGHLLSWARQGLLMLNATLTVEAGNANAHAKCGWQSFTDDVIALLNKERDGLVFLLWGGFAQKKGSRIDRSRHKVIEVAHPSPLSVAKWRGCKTFSKCNEALKALGKPEINWTLPADATATA